MSIQSNIVHVSDTVENGELEVSRFFEESELHSYKRADAVMVYSDVHDEF